MKNMMIMIKIMSIFFSKLYKAFFQKINYLLSSLQINILNISILKNRFESKFNIKVEVLTLNQKYSLRNGFFNF